MLKNGPLQSAKKMWFEERSWSNLKMSENMVEEWRDLWSYKIDFLVAAVAYTFATTNFLNLPRLVLDNGGRASLLLLPSSVAFLAAYGGALVLVVLPILVLELTVGQLIGRAPVQAFYNLSPMFRGLLYTRMISLQESASLRSSSPWRCLPA